MKAPSFSPAVRSGVVAVATVLAVAGTARLGAWQLDRAAQKLALQAQLDARGQMPPLQSDELARTRVQAQMQHDRRIVVQGHWQPQHSVFLDNRQMGGRQGFFLVTPFELSPGDAVLVQRGWAPRDIRDRAALPAVETPVGRVAISGRIAPLPGRLYSLGGDDTGVLRQNLDVESFERETGLHLRPMSLLQIESPGGADASGGSEDGLKREWPNPAVDVHKHHGYAFQWFALSSLLTGLYVWFQLLQPWLRQRRSAR